MYPLISELRLCLVVPVQCYSQSSDPVATLALLMLNKSDGGAVQHTATPLQLLL